MKSRSRRVLLSSALLVTGMVMAVPTGVDAFSGFKGRYQVKCAETEVVATPSSPTGATPGRPVSGHVLGKAIHNTEITIEEGHDRTLTAVCKSGTWEISRTGYAADWDLDVGPWSSCSASCGGGTQTREVELTCEQPANGGPDNAGTAPDAACDPATRPTKPIASRSCNTQACAPPPAPSGDSSGGDGGRISKGDTYINYGEYDPADNPYANVSGKGDQKTGKYNGCSNCGGKDNSGK